MVMQQFFEEAALQNHPLRVLADFLKAEESNLAAKKYDDMRFVGYVLDISFDTVTLITSDPFKTAVGGVPRNSMLIMVPDNVDGLPLHFTLLRVLATAATPLKQETAQTFFELHKKSMPELDVFTQAELQWGALETKVLGMFYPSPDADDVVEFAGDMNNLVSAHRYRVYAPNDALLDLIINALVPEEERFAIGMLRMTENRLPLPGKALPHVPALISASDFKGTRTAMFGKTRLGKSNLVKLICAALIKTTQDMKPHPNIGVLVFDVDGEYSNDNPQDGNMSLRSVYKDRCTVYALTQKQATPSKELRLDFYTSPKAGLQVLNALMRESGKIGSSYVAQFLSVDLPDLDEIAKMQPNDQKRAKRKILMYWAILYRAGFPEGNLARLPFGLDPGFAQPLRQQVYGGPASTPPAPSSPSALATELTKFAEADRQQALQSTSGNPLFDANDKNLLGMLAPTSTVSIGAPILGPYKKYHSPKAGDFVAEIIALLDHGQVVLLDLGNAPPEVMTYFSDFLSEAVFNHQVDRFSNNALGDRYVNMVFEEAHNLFPATDRPGDRDIYRRLAKEGAKFHIGLIYSTQSPSTISGDLLAQTENIFALHLSSQTEAKALAQVNISFDGLEQDILMTRSKGYARMLSRSHRFVIPVQARRFQVKAAAGTLKSPPAPTPVTADGAANGSVANGSHKVTGPDEANGGADDLQEDLPF